MFTGIIQDIGEVVALDKQGDWTLTIATRLPLEPMAIGASVACSGTCLTVIEKTTSDKAAGQFKVQVSPETLDKTGIARWHIGTRVNLETALRIGDELGGHLLSGHVDGILRVVSRNKDADSLHIVFEVPQPFAKFVAPKGSIAIDGVSLTINEVDGLKFGVNLIPHTQIMTTLADLKPGDAANFEVDMIARYTERMLKDRLTDQALSNKVLA